MKKYCLTGLLFLSLTASSQDSASFNQNSYKSNPGTAVMVVSGDEIRRFPTGNFLDAVNGLFPWVFSLTPDPNDFLFVLNGYLLPDVNGISLNDIEEVVFTRNNLNGSLYPFSRAGTFYIKTKSVNSRRPVIEFNSQYNVNWNKQARHIFSETNGMVQDGIDLVNESNNETGHFISNHLSLATGSEKFRLYTGLQWNDTRQPFLQQHSMYGTVIRDTLDADRLAKSYDLKALVNMEYRFSPKLQAGLSGNYFYGRTRQQTNSRSRQFSSGDYYAETTNAPGKIGYLRLNGFVNWQPLTGLRNKLFLEYGNNDYDYDSRTLTTGILGSPPGTVVTTTLNAEAGLRTYMLRNQLEYDLPLKGKFKAGAAAWFTYIENKVNNETIEMQDQGGGLGTGYISRNWTGYKEKITSLNPQLYFSYDSVITGYGGYAFLLNKGISRFNSRSRSNPYAGLSIDLKKGFKITGPLSLLELNAHYGDLSKNQSYNYWLPALGEDVFTPGLPAGSVFTGTTPIFVPNPSLSDVILKNRTISVGLNAGFHNNRLLAGIEWSSVESQQIYYLLAVPPYPTPTYLTVLGERTLQGLSGYIATSVIRQGQVEWDTRLNLLLPNNKEELVGLNNQITPGVMLNIGNYSLQAGWQNKFRFNRLFMQVNTLLGLNRTYTEISTSSLLPQEKKLNEFTLNYLLVGYDLADSPVAFFNNLSLFAQARNLFGSKEAKKFYQYDSYAGLGVNIRFK